MNGASDRQTLHGWWLLGLALLPASCAAPVRSFGTLTTAPQDRTFAMAAEGPYDAAVRDALLASGYRASSDGRYRIEVGFAVRRPRMDVMAAGGPGQTMKALAPVSSPPGLCHRQSYVLSIAFIDRKSDRIVARGGAVTSRCAGSADPGLLPRLARAALAGTS